MPRNMAIVIIIMTALHLLLIWAFPGIYKGMLEVSKPQWQVEIYTDKTLATVLSLCGLLVAFALLGVQRRRR